MVRQVRNQWDKAKREAGKAQAEDGPGRRGQGDSQRPGRAAEEKEFDQNSSSKFNLVVLEAQRTSIRHAR
jgi:hypothetical protein